MLVAEQPVTSVCQAGPIKGRTLAGFEPLCALVNLGGRPGRQPIAAGIAEPVASARERLGAGLVGEVPAVTSISDSSRLSAVFPSRKGCAGRRTAGTSVCQAGPIKGRTLAGFEPLCALVNLAAAPADNR